MRADEQGSIERKITWARPEGDGEMTSWQPWPPPLVPARQVAKHRRHVHGTGVWSTDRSVELLMMVCMGCGTEWYITSNVGCPPYTSQVACENCDFTERPPWAPKPRPFRPLVRLVEVATTLERLESFATGWQTVGQPGDLEAAVKLGKVTGNGMYVFTVQAGAKTTVEWFGVHNGRVAGISPWGFDEKGARQAPDGRQANRGQHQGGGRGPADAAATRAQGGAP